MHPQDQANTYMEMMTILSETLGLGVASEGSIALARLQELVQGAYGQGHEAGYDACRRDYDNGDMPEERR